MSKPTQLEKAIAAIDADIAILQAAKARLVQQQATQTTRKPRVVRQAPAREAIAK
jgi:hypothetical protein